MSLESRLQALEKKIGPIAASKEPPIRIYLGYNGRGPAPKPARPEDVVVVYIPGGLNDPALERQEEQAEAEA